MKYLPHDPTTTSNLHPCICIYSAFPAKVDEPTGVYLKLTSPLLRFIPFLLFSQLNELFLICIWGWKTTVLEYKLHRRRDGPCYVHCCQGLDWYLTHTSHPNLCWKNRWVNGWVNLSRKKLYTLLYKFWIAQNICNKSSFCIFIIKLEAKICSPKNWFKEFFTEFLQIILIWKLPRIFMQIILVTWIFFGYWELGFFWFLSAHTFLFK